MASKKYKFNPQTLTYEVIAIPLRLKFYRVLRKVLIGFILASVVNLLFSYFFLTPKMYNINRANNELLLKYDILNSKIAAANSRLMEIKQRDNNVYRSLFAADTLSVDGIYTPYSDAKYAAFRGDRFAGLMLSTWHSLDAMARVLYLESRSLDELETLSRNKELMADAIPAIWPIDKRSLKHRIGAFGTRVHPILGRSIFHKGVDLGAKQGTPVYATANGRVAFDNEGASGYGKQVLLNHGFGYKTRYAHLSKMLVVPGQLVKRGEKIGEVGNTGRSTGDHLHYEVIYKNRNVDPLNYFSRDMSEEEFSRIIDDAATTYETGL